jgi:hypothetical protein
MNNFDKIFLAIQSITNKFIVCVHDESKGYVFKTFDNQWFTISFEFVNYIAGLGEKNYSLL